MKFLRDIRVGTRLSIGFALILSLSLVTAGVGLWRLASLADSVQSMMEEPLAKERLSEEWYRYIYAGSRRTSAIAKSSDASLEAFFAEDAKRSNVRGNELQKELESRLRSDEERALFDAVKEKRQAYVSIRKDVYALKAAGNYDAAGDLLEKQFLPASQAYLGAMSDFVDYQKRHIDETAQAIHVAYAESRMTLLLLIVGSVLLSIGSAVVLTRSIVTPIRVASAAITKIAEGNLAAVPNNLSGNDEFGKLLLTLDAMRVSLAAKIERVRSGTSTISVAAKQIAAGNLDLSSRTENQASTLEETARSMDRLTHTVAQNADNAGEANRYATSAAEVAQRGGESVSEVISTMSSIAASSRHIVDIISVIDSIAFQTNILALNAAVEAARAGENGRGFSVVASEVRVLAQRSATAAKEIKSLIENSVDQINNGSKLVDATGHTMQEMLASVNGLTQIIGGISDASRDQSESIQQINQAIAAMDQSTQENAALVEEAAAAAQSLDEQAHNLMLLVTEFRLETQSL